MRSRSATAREAQSAAAPSAAAPESARAVVIHRGRNAHRAHSRGQSMVEFALVLPIFLLVIIAIIEFAFAFSTMNSLNFAARDLAQFAAEAGDQPGGDCSALNLLEGELGAATNPAGLTSVVIYWSDGNGNVVGGATNQYDRTGSMTCTDVNGVSLTLPYSLVSATYPEAQRCPVLLGCPSISHPTLDTIGVRITYSYAWRTSLADMLAFTGPPIFISTQQVRMEPVL